MVYDAKLAHVAWGKVPARSRTMISIERVGVPLTQAIRTGKILVGDACAHIRLAIDELLSIGLAHWDVRVDKNVSTMNRCVWPFWTILNI